MHSRHWGVSACYLAHYQGRYSAWITGADPSDRSQAYGMPSEPAGRAFVDAWLATNLLHTPWDERIATIFLLSPRTRRGLNDLLRLFHDRVEGGIVIGGETDELTER